MKVFNLLLFILISQAASAAEVLLADRYYVKSVLINVFGDSANSTIDEKIIKNGAHFGGPCDMYQQVRTGKLDADIKDQSTFCLDGATGTRLPLVAKNNMFRESVMSLVCQQLSQNSKTLNFALKKSGTGIDNLPNTQSIDNVVKLFNPVAEHSTAMANSLLKSKSLKKLSPPEQWQIIVKSVCTDISWQIL